MFRATDGRGRNPGELVTDMTGPGFALMPSTQAAIADSHMRAWEAAFNNKDSDKFAAFFEDDAIIRTKDERNFAHILSGAIEEAEICQADILMIGCFSSPAMSLILGLSGACRPRWLDASSAEQGLDAIPFHELKYTNRPNVATGAHAYILSRKGYDKIIKELKGNITTYLDYEIQYLNARASISLLAISPRIVFQTSTASLEDRIEASQGAPREVADLIIKSGSSSSSRSCFPILLSSFLDNFSVDEYVSARYISNVEMFSISENVSLTPAFLILIVVSAIYTSIFILSNSIFNEKIKYLQVLCILYFLFVLPDIKAGNVKKALLGFVFIIIPPIFAISKM